MRRTARCFINCKRVRNLLWHSVDLYLDIGKHLLTCLPHADPTCLPHANLTCLPFPISQTTL